VSGVSITRSTVFITYTKLVDNQVLYGNMDERTLAKEAKEGHFPGKTCPDHGIF
jgi:hypothetical protein